MATEHEFSYIAMVKGDISGSLPSSVVQDTVEHHLVEERDIAIRPTILPLAKSRGS